MIEDDGLLQHIEDLRSTLAGAPRALAALLEGRTAEGLDISEASGALRAARRQLADGRALLQGIFDATREAMLLVDDRGTYVDANDAACDLFDAERDLVLGRNVGELQLVGVEVHSAWAGFVEGGSFVHDVTFERSEDDLKRVQMNGLANVLPGIHLLVLRDVTERGRNEANLRRAEDQLRQLQKMDAIGALAGGVAHDFNNLLSIILSYANLVLEESEPGSQLRADVEEIRRAGERSSDLTRQLLAFSRQQVLRPQVIDLGSVVSGMEKMLKRLLGEDIELILESSRLLGRVLADPSQVEQIVLNLAVNARDAMPRGGKLILETRNYALDEIDADGLGDPDAAGPHVLLAATDTGIGMDEKTRARIFEPFFTTKEPGKGTGLGLSTVFGIVKQSKGHVRVESEVGIGTRFEIFFPQTAQPFRTMTSAPVSSTDRGTETILVVEDEAQVRVAICTVLKRHGYRVLDAENAGEAFLLAEQHRKPIQLLLTDVVLPRLAGTELADRLIQSHPGLRVLYMSGYAAGVVQDRLNALGDAAFLQKPIVPKTLLRKVREVLATPMIRYV